MSCYNLSKAFRFIIRTSKHYNFQSRIICIACYKSSLLTLQKLKYRFKIDNQKTFNSIHTSRMQLSTNDDSEEELEDLTQPLVKLTFISHKGEEFHIEGRAGTSVMRAAVKNKVPMEGACEGQLACTTCHVYVEEETKKYFEDASLEEEDLLDSAPFVKPNSRLSCQLKIAEDWSNVRFHLPPATANFSVDKKKDQS